MEEQVPVLVKSQVTQEIEKIQIMQRNEALRYRGIGQVNSQSNPDRKVGSDVPFSYLRRMAQLYPIARACINRRIRQITQLEWDITTIYEIEGEQGYETQIAEIKNFFKHPTGHKSKMRGFLTQMVDDVLTLDAICYEKQKTRGGDFMYLIPVDPTTIALRVTQTGGTPEPPETAYVQIVEGRELAGYTTDEMIYEKMNERSYSPYGMAPLESLIIQVESALRGALYNLAYFKENNTPEGFVMLPEEVASNRTTVEEWQLWFDSLIAGDPRFMHRLKILPGGSEYVPSRKPEDMAFEKFELWLLQQTCAVFDVPPQDIGITYQVNKATADSQSDLSRERGLLPLGNFTKEVLDTIIQEDLGHPELQLMWRNINPVDRKEEAEIAKTEIEMGALSVDEYRIEQGREPIGLTHYISTSSGPIKVDDFIKGITPQQQQTKDKQDQNNEQDQQEEIKRWRKCVYRDIEAGRDIRTKFPTNKIAADLHEEISKGLENVHSRWQAKVFFDQYLDPEVKASLTLLRYADELHHIEQGLNP